MTSAPYLSACIMCKDEAHVLDRCLSSLVGVVDEILFLDTGSTDRSVEIAAKYGATISHYVWADNFSEARNETMRRASGRWALIIDCDERLTGTLTEPGALKAVLADLEKNETEAWPIIFVKMSVIDTTLEEDTRHGLSRQLRIFPRDPAAIYYESIVHNRLTVRPDLHEHVGRTLELTTEELNIMHVGYDRRIQAMKKKPERARRLIEKALEDKPDGLNHMYLGREQVHAGEWDAAVKTLRKARDLLNDDVMAGHHLSAVYFYLVWALHEGGYPLEETRAELLDGLRLYPFHADLWQRAGRVFASHGEHESARDAYLQAIKALHTNGFESSFLSQQPWTAHFELAAVYASLGDVPKGHDALRAALAAGAPEPDAIRDILDARPVVGYVRAGMASVPARVDQLALAVRSIVEQVDALHVYLNGYDEVPAFLNHPKIHVSRSQDHGDLRDTGKFWSLRCADYDYYFSLDDDIVYPPNYVSTLVAKIEQYERKAVVGVHGADLLPEVTSYIRDRDVVHCLMANESDRAVDIIGTGTAAFHKDTLKIGLEDFQMHGMTDVWFSLAAFHQRVPCIAVQRRANWLMVLEVADTLYEEAAKDDTAQTAAVQVMLRALGPKT